MTTTAADRYRALITDLVTASRRHDAAVSAANQSYAEAMAGIAHDVAAAEEAASLASMEAALAQRTVAQTDLAAAALWDDLKRVRGRRGKRLGPVPTPALPPAGTSSTLKSPAGPDDLLEQASGHIELIRRGGEPLRPALLPLLFLIGAAASTLLALFGIGLLSLGWLRLLTVPMGWIALLGAPLAGLAPARRWVDERYAARLDPGATGLVLLAGMLATAAIALTFR